MGYYRSDDPARDFDRWDRDLEQRRSRFPVCERCRNTIYEQLFDIEERTLCLECVITKYGRTVEVDC